ncbi:hypothetical protein [Shouchella patagoniensis]|uniref:hypothetical protein n=1 Tax=Shouchella patagoniensis TaxID=228576 RepID=UPI00099526BD|nr:hypothetical protein [Shouchella patagoniensis]
MNDKEHDGFLNEEALDVSVQFLEYFAESYRKDNGKPPTISDLCNVLRVALDLEGELHFDELKNHVAASVSVYTMPLDSLSDIKPGAIIEIYLPEIEKYSYAVVVKGNAGEDRQAHIYMQFYHLFSKEQLSSKQVRKHFFEKEPAFLVCVTRTGFMEGDWQVIDQQKPIIDEKVVEGSYFVYFENGQYYLSEGNAYVPLEEMVKVQPRIGRRCGNPAGKLDSSMVEQMLCELYEGNSLANIIRYKL